MINRRSLLSSLVSVLPSLAFLPSLKMKVEECITFPNGDKSFPLGNNRFRLEKADGTIEWTYAGLLHREDGPALIGKQKDKPRFGCSGSGKGWYRFGKLHREGGPAILMEDGETHWYVDGKRHRLDGPASVYADGGVFWRKNDLLHREDGGPASIDRFGSQRWYRNGRLHRDNLPVTVDSYGLMTFYVNGNYITHSYGKVGDHVPYLKYVNGKYYMIGKDLLDKYAGQTTWEPLPVGA